MTSPGPSTRKNEQEATRQALSDIDECQKALNELYSDEWRKVKVIQFKHDQYTKPLYDKRTGLIEKIPDFWENVFVNHHVFEKVVDVEEKDCLFFLKKMDFENMESGFSVKFIFDENPFFENWELVKEFHLGPNKEPKSMSTTIKWKENMDLSKKQQAIIDARRRAGEEEERTFFSWFSDNKNAIIDDIAVMIKDDLWPNPLQYYEMEIEADEDLEEGEEPGIYHEICQALNDMGKCQKKLKKQNEKAFDEILEVETKYNTLRKPFYDKRAGVIEKIPQFWGKALSSFLQMRSGVTREEKKLLLHYQENFEIEEIEEFNSFEISFYFHPNPYFLSPALIRHVFIGFRREAYGSHIDWDKMIAPPPRDPSKPVQRRGFEYTSFFEWFCDDEVDPAADYLAKVIKDIFWTDPLQFYLMPNTVDEDEDM